MPFISDTWQLLAERTPSELLHLFWFVLLFDIPRYCLGFAAIFVLHAFSPVRRASPPAGLGRVSVLVAGHNEELAFERCVNSLQAQTWRELEIICVDDGSTDGTWATLARLSRAGLVDRALRLRRRSGKSAALNLAAEMASGEVLIVVDCDCTFAPDAVEQLLVPMRDPAVAAAGAAVLVRNSDASLVTSLQAVDYLFSIQLGRALLDVVGLVTCVSGAMGAFRRAAWREAGGMDVGPGEDLDITLRLRRRGYKIRFCRAARCWTDVPETLVAFLRQRRRWERDAFRIRFRKSGITLNPLSPRFLLAEAVHQLEFIIYCIISALVFMLYVTNMATVMPDYLPVVLLATAILLVFLDVLTLLVASVVYKEPAYIRLVPFALLFSPFQFVVMRNARLAAYAAELIFSTSRHDDFVPARVRRWVTWH